MRPGPGLAISENADFVASPYDTQPMATRDVQADSLEQGPRVLIVRPSALGDVSRTVPALVTLRETHPHAHIDWLVQEEFVDVISAHPALDGVIRFPRKRFGSALYNPQAAIQMLKWLRGLGENQYDLAVDLQGLLRSGLFTRFTGAGKRLGFANAREGAALVGRYTHRYQIDTRLHAVDRMLGLLEADGCEIAHDMRLYVPAADAQWLEGFISPEVDFVCLAPTARWACKCWPIENWIDLAQRILDLKVASKIVVLAGPDEKTQIKPLLDAFNDADSSLIYPRTTVGQMMALLQRCKALVSNDSAPLHIAVGLDRPVVGIYGPTDPALVGPYRRVDAVVQPEVISPQDMINYRKRRDDQRLIARIDVDRVWQNLQLQLSKV